MVLIAVSLQRFYCALLMCRYSNNTFLESEVQTIGSDFKLKYIEIDDVACKLQIWDTAGQEKFRQMTSSYFGGANVVCVVYDVSSKESFDKVENWITEAQKYCNNIGGREVQFFVVGTIH